LEDLERIRWWASVCHSRAEYDYEYDYEYEYE